MKRAKWLILFISVCCISNVAYAWSSGGASGGGSSSTFTGRYTILEVTDYVYQNDLGNPADGSYVSVFLDNKDWVNSGYYKDREVSIENFTFTPADLIYYSGHGNIYGEFILSPDGQDDINYSYYDIISRGNWNGAKWVIFGACSMVNISSGWNDTFTPNSNSVHAILGYNSDITNGDATAMVQEYMSYLFGDSDFGYPKYPVVDAWKQSANRIGLGQWSVFYLGGTKNEYITQPVDPNNDYTVWFARESYTGVVNDVYGISPVVNDLQLNPHSDQHVKRNLEDGLITLNYKKPKKQKMYKLFVSPEIKDFQKYETQFYHKHGGVLSSIFDLRKQEFKNKIVYTNGSDVITYFKGTGAVEYGRTGSKKIINKDIKEAVKIAEDFLKEFGGGLPKDAKLDYITSVQHTNLTTGESYIENYQLHFSKYFKNVKIGGKAADGIVIEVDADGISFFNRLWREYKIDEKVEIKTNQILDDEDVIIKNAKKVWANIRSNGQPIQFTEVNLVYRSTKYDSSSNEVVVAWEYKTDDALVIYIDALTGELLD